MSRNVEIDYKRICRGTRYRPVAALPVQNRGFRLGFSGGGSGQFSNRLGCGVDDLTASRGQILAKGDRERV